MVLTGKEAEEFIKEKGIQHFKAHEFACPHCGDLKIDSHLILLLEDLREHLSKPLIVTSGYRCPEHNRKVGGVPNSAHTGGLAVDIRCLSSRTRYRILEFLLKRGIQRIGVGRDFIHIDIDDEKPKPVLWHYYGEK